METKSEKKDTKRKLARTMATFEVTLFVPPGKTIAQVANAVRDSLAESVLFQPPLEASKLRVKLTRKVVFYP